MAEKNKLINIFALVGFFILIGIAIWSSWQIIKLSPSLFSEKFSKPSFSLNLPFFKKKEELTLNKKSFEVVSGKPITVSWNLSTSKEGELFFSYACVPKVHFRLPAVSYSASNEDIKVDELNYTVLPCNAPHKLNPDQNKLVLIPVSDEQEPVAVKFAIAYAYSQPQEGTPLLQDIAEVKIRPTNYQSDPKKEAKETLEALQGFLLGSNTTTPPTPETSLEKVAQRAQNTKNLYNQEYNQGQNKLTNTSNTTNATQTPKTTISRAPVRYVTVQIKPINNPNGLADLDVQIISVGAIDPVTGAFIPKGTLSLGERAAVKFKVKNLGDKETGIWNYKADLPTYPKYYYISKPQPSLLPGGEADVIVSFDQLIPGRVNATIQVDPYNSIIERNETNNTDTVFFDVVRMNLY